MAQPLRPHVSLKLPDLVPPGPADYTPYRTSSFSPTRSQHRLQPGKSFPKTRRWQSDSVLTPGPVNYWSTRRDQQGKWGRGQPKFSDVPREQGSALTPAQGPGPCDYKPYGESSKPRGSFPKSRRWRDNSSPSPGPVSYWNTRRVRDEASIQPRASPKFGTVKRALTEVPLSPGPSDYSPKGQSGSPKQSIPQARRWQSEPSLATPGPVSYWHTKRDFSTQRGTADAINGQPKFSVVPRLLS
eukprot:TRINITY_DN78125_c0_g1_i1.p1 TRINITY_DN78125_c0_g1~~TRINITY_DN78125_c0_g1_i1.p1  ORF type:complete len:242 (+),score=7.01 TRINITY_DN78125_c0_g1_i1:88-813(+)